MLAPTRRIGLRPQTGQVGALLAVISIIGFGIWARSEPAGVDFHTYLAATHVGLQDGWAHIYDQSLVTSAELSLAPSLVAQPYLSPPPVAWLVSVVALFPYPLAAAIWAALTLTALAGATWWSSGRRGVAGWLGVALAVAPTAVLISVRVGQVVPLVAASVLIAWRLLREDCEMAAGLVLSLVLLKPNTAFLVPIAVLAAGRVRAFATFAVAAAAVVVAMTLSVGVAGLSHYAVELQQPPPGTDALSLGGALGAHGIVAVLLRLIVVAAVIACALRMRRSIGLAIAVGAVGSLLVTPYLHFSDLTMLAAAGWIVWHERPAIQWRAPLVLAWVVSSPMFAMAGLVPSQNRWPLIELAVLCVMTAAAYSDTALSRRLAARVAPMTSRAIATIRAPRRPRRVEFQ